MRSVFSILALTLLMCMVTATCLLFKLPPQVHYSALVLYVVVMCVLFTGFVASVRIIYD